MPDSQEETEPINNKNEASSSEGQWFQGMAWTTRIQGYLLFTVLGMFASFMGWIALSMGSTWKYSVLTTLGQVMSLSSTLLLMGPQKQLASMFDVTRREATVLYLGSMVLTVFVAVTTHSTLLCAVCGIVEYAALIWYSVSYIPYGREGLKNLASGLSRVVMNSS